MLRTIDESSIHSWVEAGHAVFNRLEDLPCVTVALVEGYALGGGLELALCCDLIFASENARFGLPETRLGFIPGWGGVFRLAARVGPSKAKELMFTAAMVDTPTARGLGLVDRSFATDQAGEAFTLSPPAACSNSFG